MVLPLTTPTWTASPPNSGTVTISATSTGEAPGWPAGHSLYQAYTYTATPAAGYHFVRFEFTEVHSSSSTSGQDPDVTVTGTFTDNPHVSAPGTNEAPWAVIGVAWSYDYNGFPGFEPYNLQDWSASIQVVAVFAPDHTNLLVYDDRPNGSGLLVYDDRPGGTGLLVADY